MKTNYNLLFLFIFALLSLSCKDGWIEKKKLFGENFLQQEIIFSEKMEQPVRKILDLNKYLLISYIDSSVCTPCYLDNYKIYKTYENQFESYNILPVLIIETGIDIEPYEDWIKEASLTFPILFDIEGEFKVKNNLPEDEKYQTFLINKDKKVIWIGSPVQNKKSWELFQKMMKKIR